MRYLAILVCVMLAGGIAMLDAQPIDRAEIADILLAGRNDLELLANAVFGSAERPASWSGSYDIDDDQMALLLRLDLENLATSVTENAEMRPPGWFGVVPSVSFATARDIRHDIELLADVVIQPSVRPPGWLGDDPYMRCPRATQSLVAVLQATTDYTPTVSAATPDYCFQLGIEASQYAELTLLNNDRPLATAADAPASPTFSASIIETSASYYDRAAERGAGAIPVGTLFTPLGRSTAAFSRMTLIEGADFAVFVDFRSTTLSVTEFEALPSIDALGATPYCNASWCN